ncbi:RNA-binding S4 domain-containing protein [Thioclava sp.]|uniref:RNA-binding S4 domain-containing protein n=1 Tax=Thioclava sp. TaxID=1933450 RepID=UPI003AA9D77F
MADAPDRIRIDKWLWHARFCKTRALAQELVSGKRVRVNGARIDKPGRVVGPGDVLTLRIGTDLRLVRVLDCGIRRGPASEAQSLYEPLDPTP